MADLSKYIHISTCHSTQRLPLSNRGLHQPEYCGVSEMVKVEKKKAARTAHTMQTCYWGLCRRPCKRESCTTKPAVCCLFRPKIFIWMRAPVGKTGLMGSHVMPFSQVSGPCVIACFIIKRIGHHFLPIISTFVGISAGNLRWRKSLLLHHNLWICQGDRIAPTGKIREGISYCSASHYHGGSETPYWTYCIR